MSLADAWTVKEWIIRGLNLSCISKCDLYRWYEERALHPVDLNEFREEFELVKHAGYVYIQRQVPCRTHGDHRVDGWSLTDLGMTEDPMLKREDR